jgi:predicted transcriptional regulator
VSATPITQSGVQFEQAMGTRVVDRGRITMRKQVSIGVCVLVAFCILSVGPLAFVTATHAHSTSHDRNPGHNSVTADENTLQPVPSPNHDWYPFKLMIKIIKKSGYDEVSLASVSSTVVASYSRYDDSDPLVNPVRLQIYDAIEQSPGASISEISDQTEISRSTVRYHVRILEEEQLITSKSHRGKHRLYPVDESHHDLSAALNEEMPAMIITAVVHHGPLTVTELSDVVDRTPGTVSYHLDRLIDDGLLTKNQDGNAMMVSPTAEVQEIVTKNPSVPATNALPSVSTASLD